jgi:hypothetical protein
MLHAINGFLESGDPGRLQYPGRLEDKKVERDRHHHDRALRRRSMGQGE